MNSKCELAVNNIPPTIFSIPHYQRGYRWTTKEVTALLDDLLAFTENNASGEAYCLQPLVLQKNINGGFNVVDGQQRLTTIAIILHTLDIPMQWDIKYTSEGGRLLSDLLKSPGKSINDHFRSRAREAVGNWLKHCTTRRDYLSKLLTGDLPSKVIFLRYEIAALEDGHAVFQRLNEGKTPLTSSELIRAFYMETGNGLIDSEKADIAKEWDLIEAEMGNEQFWAIWANDRFRDVPTRMDFLFSVALDIKSDEARHNPLLVYSRFETTILNEKSLTTNLREQWEEVLRCWWWMLSCYADVETFHLLGWLSLFTERETRVLYREQWKDASGCRMAKFKHMLRKIIAESIGDVGFDSFKYVDGATNALRKVLVLLNMLEAERRGILFRVDLYLKYSWDIEHIASQTDNPLKDEEDQKEWLRLAEAEMSEDEKSTLAQFKTFQKKWNKVWGMFEQDDIVSDKNGMGNLALLDSGTNRSYKNAIFPAKRRQILLKVQSEQTSVLLGKDAKKADVAYIPPGTEAAFEKSYSPGAAQMRYWGNSDAIAYYAHMEKLFNDFMSLAKEDVK